MRPVIAGWDFIALARKEVRFFLLPTRRADQASRFGGRHGQRGRRRVLATIALLRFRDGFLLA